MRTYRRNPLKRQGLSKYKYNGDIFTYALFLVVLAIGVTAGSLIAVNTDLGSIDGITQRISDLGGTLALGNMEKSVIFSDSFIKHIKIVIFLWLCTFINFGGLISSVIIFIKAMGVGLTASLVIMEYGVRGVYYSLFLIIIQNTVLFMVFFFIIKESIGDFTENAMGASRTIGSKNTGSLERLMILIIASLLVLIVAFYEANVCPIILG
ncbi:MAG: hypothetical protein LBU94_04565 [Clostridiales bacterium]|nr:hypothetical protein [Clostridiales bacterium]